MTIKDFNNIIKMSNIKYVSILPEIKNEEDRDEQEGYQFTIDFDSKNSYLPKWLEKLEIESIEIDHMFIIIRIKLPKDITFNFIKNTIELFFTHNRKKNRYDNTILKRDNIINFLNNNNINKDDYELIITELKKYYNNQIDDQCSLNYLDKELIEIATETNSLYDEVMQNISILENIQY